MLSMGVGPTLTSMTEPAVNDGIDGRIVVHYSIGEMYTASVDQELLAEVSAVLTPGNARSSRR